MRNDKKEISAAFADENFNARIDFFKLKISNVFIVVQKEKSDAKFIVEATPTFVYQFHFCKTTKTLSSLPRF